MFFGGGKLARRIKLLKSNSKDVYKVIKKVVFQINAVLLNFIFIKKYWDSMYHIFHSNIKQTMYNISEKVNLVCTGECALILASPGRLPCGSSEFTGQKHYLGDILRNVISKSESIKPHRCCLSSGGSKYSGGHILLSEGRPLFCMWFYVSLCVCSLSSIKAHDWVKTHTMCWKEEHTTREREKYRIAWKYRRWKSLR